MNMYIEKIILNFLNPVIINLKHEIPEAFRFNRLVAINKFCCKGTLLHSAKIVMSEHHIGNDAPFKVLFDTQMLKLQLLVVFVTLVDKFVSLHHQHQGMAFYSLTTLIGQAAFNAFMNHYWYTQSLN